MSVVVLAAIGAPLPLFAHDLGAALLDIRVRSGQPTLDVVLRQSAAASAPEPSLAIDFPRHCVEQPGSRQLSPTIGGVESRWRISCGSRGIVGHRVGFVRSPGQKPVAVLVTVGQAATGRSAWSTVVSSSSDGVVIAAATDDKGKARSSSRAPVALAHVWQGISHLLSGIDHVLFLLGLLLLCRGRKQLIATVSGFTIGHSISLCLVSLGVWALHPVPVEIMIAASLMLLARSVLETNDLSQTTMAPLVFALGFGVVHGFGFAGAMQTLGMSDAQLPWALLGFNVGIELGQLALVCAALAVMTLVTRWLRVRERVVRYGISYAVGITGGFLMWQRVWALLPA